MIICNSTEIVNLFPPKSGELSGINYISNLLWALEILAWSPEYLVHSISVLGLLEALPYERTNWTNTPINSIVSILLPWYPQTMADLEKRKNALKCLKTDNPRVFWSTLKKLLPNKTRSTSGNPRPKYLKLEIPEEVKVTNAEAHECYVYLVELAVDTARNENEKLVELIDQLGYMYEPTLTDYLECLENSFEFGTDENTFEVWLKLRECMARIEPTEGKVIYKHLDRIQQLIEKMEPTDIRVKHREWYLGNRYLFDKGNYANRWKMLEDKKLSAVKEIFDEYGSEEVERFGSAVKNVHDVANKLGHFLKPKEMSSIIEKCFIGILSKEFTINCLISFVYTQGAEKLLETSLCQMEDEFMLEILSKIPFSLQLLDVINQVLDDDTAYKNELAVELAKCRTLNEKILHKEIFIYDEEFKIYKEIMPGFRKVSKSVLDYLVIIKLLVEKGIEDTTEGKEKIQKAYASAYEMTFAYYDLVMDEGIFIEEQTYVMLMNFFAHCEKILRINLNPENWKDMKWDEIIDNQINEENKITCHLRNKIRSC